MVSENKLVRLIIDNHFVNFLLRISVLGIIVFAVLQYMLTDLPMMVKISISMMVVLTYSVLDLMGNQLSRTTNTLCDVFC